MRCFISPSGCKGLIPRLLLALSVGVLTGCVRKTVHPIAALPPPGDLANDNSFMDLLPGGHLRIVVPVLTSDWGYKPETAPQQTAGNTLTLKASNLIGFDTSHFRLDGRTDGRVRIHFLSAETSREGQINPAAHAPELPFSLPTKLEHVRLIYLTRSSQVDHNMAIAAARTLPALNQFTGSLQADPRLCGSNSAVFCTWVPPGVAVRPE